MKVSNEQQAMAGTDQGTSAAVPTSTRRRHERNWLPDWFQPTENDTICGRGRAVLFHAGNRKFREIVSQRLDEYSQCGNSKHKKSKLIGSVVKQVRAGCENGVGGFVKLCPVEGRWYEVGDTWARERTSQAFRDVLDDLYKSSIHAKKLKRKLLKEGDSSTERGPRNKRSEQARTRVAHSDLSEPPSASHPIESPSCVTSEELPTSQSALSQGMEWNTFPTAPVTNCISADHSFSSLDAIGSSNSCLVEPHNYCSSLEGAGATLQFEKIGQPPVLVHNLTTTDRSLSYLYHDMTAPPTTRSVLSGNLCLESSSNHLPSSWSRSLLGQEAAYNQTLGSGAAKPLWCPSSAPSRSSLTDLLLSRVSWSEQSEAASSGAETVCFQSKSQSQSSLPSSAMGWHPSPTLSSTPRCTVTSKATADSKVRIETPILATCTREDKALNVSARSTSSHLGNADDNLFERLSMAVFGQVQTKSVRREKGAPVLQNDGVLEPMPLE